ncbi:hypothetical protein TpMuguga_01g02670 [Theileria parva strain Muguga]|uniref:uncharacterized protein n=1 Tax=Theileria parva strain Muguga TaxID=333668 RepID=UPI001C618BCB|nr:uncharacterized protein TpMuguga_01g02670 [Theileria parva strain Muguga]KAF5153433.1 hypothetical protein TpMuguga_01g02670 [Theileria parva strain Muguga]
MSGSEPGNVILKNILKGTVRAPRILWWQANEILFKLQKQQRSASKTHPCTATWLKLVRCMRRFPHNMTKKCSGEASRHYQCTLTNKEWTMEEDVSYIKILESFNLLQKRPSQQNN